MTIWCSNIIIKYTISCEIIPEKMTGWSVFWLKSEAFKSFHSINNGLSKIILVQLQVLNASLHNNEYNVSLLNFFLCLLYLYSYCKTFTKKIF